MICDHGWEGTGKGYVLIQKKRAGDMYKMCLVNIMNVKKFLVTVGCPVKIHSVNPNLRRGKFVIITLPLFFRLVMDIWPVWQPDLLPSWISTRTMFYINWRIWGQSWPQIVGVRLLLPRRRLEIVDWAKLSHTIMPTIRGIILKTRISCQESMQ